MVIEAGASVKEAQTLLRHSTPQLTMNAYARARDHRLAEVAERVGGPSSWQRAVRSPTYQEHPGGRALPPTTTQAPAFARAYMNELVEAGGIESPSRDHSA